MGLASMAVAGSERLSGTEVGNNAPVNNSRRPVARSAQTGILYGRSSTWDTPLLRDRADRTELTVVQRKDKREQDTATVRVHFLERR